MQARHLFVDALAMQMVLKPETLDVIRRHGIRAGMKGYPKSRTAAEDMVDAAQANGFEAICIHITYVDRRMLGYSQARGVWHLTWELNEKTPAQWRWLSGQLGKAGKRGTSGTERVLAWGEAGVYYDHHNLQSSIVISYRR